MKTILVASDLSVRSDRAVQRALRLARAHGAACHVVHAVDEDLPPGMAEAWRAEAEAQLGRVLASAEHGATATATAVIGDPLVVIAEAARADDADIVVFGLHRPRPFLDTLRETTVERLVRLIDRPALLVRDPADHDHARVLAPVSFSPACAAALTAARVLAPAAEIRALHAVYLPFAGLTDERPGGAMDRDMRAEAETRRNDWCATQGLAAELCAVTPITGSLGEVIGREVRAFRPDLIALGAHTRGGLAPHTLGSFAAELIRNPPTDLLLARG